MVNFEGSEFCCKGCGLISLYGKVWGISIKCVYLNLVIYAIVEETWNREEQTWASIR